MAYIKYKDRKGIDKNGFVFSRIGSCFNRRMHKTEDEAKQHANQSTGPWKFRQEHCIHCGSWHNIRFEFQFIIVEQKTKEKKLRKFDVVDSTTGEVVKSDLSKSEAKTARRLLEVNR
jgi:hypothetical protein